MHSTIITIILSLAFLFNTYKISLASSQPYYIFPWSPHPQISKSTPEQLQCHIVSGLILLSLAYIRCLFPRSPLNKIIFSTWNLLFTVILIPMLDHFGDSPSSISILINGGLLVVLQLIYRYSSPLLYFYILSIPVIFEVMLFLQYRLNFV